MNGVLPLWKPKGMTSHDCVMKIRRLFNTRKVGHTGTLDPEVEGVLGICIGQATKIVPYLTDTKKVYLAECSLGKATETEDAHGQTIEEVVVTHPPTKNELEQTLEKFKGEITQIPPMYSAVKVKGKKLYEYARANQTVERPVRRVKIYELTNLTQEEEALEKFKLRIACSAGTYIRTLCVDIGSELGYPAHMSNLTRIEASSFTTSDTVTFEEIEEAKKQNQLSDLLVPMINTLNFLDQLHVSEDVKFKVMNGQKLEKPSKEMQTNPFLVIFNQELLAIYQAHPEEPHLIKPVRVFH